MISKRVSARKTTFFKPKSAMKAMGYSLTKLLKFFSFLGKSHSAEKKKRNVASYRRTYKIRFPLKWAKMYQSFPFYELLCVFIVHWLFLSLKFI